VAEPLRVLVGALAAGSLPTAIPPAPPEGTLLLDLGPDHPSSAGLLELQLWVGAGVVESVRVVVGAMHRGAEKLFEVRDYRQILMLADRHDWQAPFAGELTIALACERLLGLEPPPRAVWLRTLLAEHTRILSHLGFLGYVPYRLGRVLPVLAIRERLREQTRALTGNRIHPMVNRIGGLAADADADWLTAERIICGQARDLAQSLRDLMHSVEFASEASGLASLRASTVSGYGVSGPAARASGIDLDLRRTAPYLAYGELADQLPSISAIPAGDALARMTMLADEVITSSLLVDACADRLAALPGVVGTRIGKLVKLPEGEIYAATEAPLGMAGVHLVSRGEKTPWRLRLRTPSFSNIAALESVLVGVAVDRLETALASLGYVVGDIDK